MGCGSSSLKGEKVDDIKPEPAMKKVRTNFSDVDFSGDAGNSRRLTVAVAPDEQRRPTKISENIEEETGPTEPAAKPPYQPPPGDDELASPSTQPTQLELPPTDPTASPSKDTFASSNAPISNQESQPVGTSTSGAGLSPPDTHADTNTTTTSTSEPRRKSWFARLTGDARGSQSKEISDEDLQKNLGMTRAQFEEWKKDPKNKVGPRQDAADSSAAHYGGGS